MSTQDKKHHVRCNRAMAITVLFAAILAWFFPWAVLGYTFLATSACVLIDDRRAGTVMVAFGVYIIVCIVIYALLDYKDNIKIIEAFFKKHLKH